MNNPTRLLIVFLATFLLGNLIGGCLVGAQTPARFHFVSRDQIDHASHVLLIRDTTTETCYAQFTFKDMGLGARAFSGIHVLEVPCGRVTIGK